ncbi:MAG TPA: hypothetical protein H9830_09470, partial [Candidatus Agrococcus pullicola]|nr:hypothetical protein [Candidatus Agrococcus pullicola]
GIGLFIATATAASFTQIAANSNFEIPADATQISSLVDGANPLTGLFFAASELGGWTVAVLGVLALAFAFLVRFIERRRDIARASEAAAATSAEA